MLPAPGNAPAAAAGRPGAGDAGGRGDAWGEPGLGMPEGWLLPTPAQGTSLVPMSHPRMRPLRVPSPPGAHATPLPHCFGSFITWGTEEVSLGAPLVQRQPPVSPLPVPTGDTHRWVAQRMRCHLPRGRKEESAHPQSATSTGQSCTDPRPPPNRSLPVCPCSPPTVGSGAVGRVQGAPERCQPLSGCPAALGRGRWCGEAVTLPVSAPAQSTAAPPNQAS